MPTAIVLPVEPDQPVRLEQLPERDPDAYRHLVRGDLERVNLYRPPACLYFNEEGKALQMPVNDRATALLWAHNRRFRGRDAIAGPAFIVGPPDGFGYDSSAPQDLINLLCNTWRYRIQVQVADDPSWYGNEMSFTDWREAYRYGVTLAQRWTLVNEVRVVPEVDDTILEAWYQIGQHTSAIRAASKPPFTKDSFVNCYSIEELAEQISATARDADTAFYLQDLCFIQQVDGGDEWLTIRHGIPFESLSLLPHITNGTFASLVHRLLAASKEQCEQSEY